jgi:hypothetical protein
VDALIKVFGRRIFGPRKMRLARPPINLKVVSPSTGLAKALKINVGVENDAAPSEVLDVCLYIVSGLDHTISKLSLQRLRVLCALLRLRGIRDSVQLEDRIFEDQLNNSSKPLVPSTARRFVFLDIHAALRTRRKGRYGGDGCCCTSG